jgi:hypothetical protein
MKERHVSLSVRQGVRTYRAVMWRGVEWSETIEANRNAIDVAYALERNTYMGETNIELRLAAVRPADAQASGTPEPVDAVAEA